jgi:hypothetical protein
MPRVPRAGPFSHIVVERGAPALPELELIDDSPWLNPGRDRRARGLRADPNPSGPT